MYVNIFTIERYRVFLILIAILVSIVGCKKDEIELIQDCDDYTDQIDPGTDIIIIPFQDSTVRAYNASGQQIWFQPIRWTRGILHNDHVYGARGNMIYIVEPVTGQLVNSIEIDHEILAVSSFGIWNDHLIYGPANDSLACCRILKKNLYTDDPSELVTTFYGSTSLVGDYLTIREQGESTLRVIDLRTEVETTLPYRELEQLDNSGNLYGVEVNGDSRILRAHHRDDLSVEWEIDISDLPMYYPQKLEEGLLYFLGGIDQDRQARQATIVNESDGSEVGKLQIYEYSEVPDMSGSLVNTDGLFYYRTDNTGWSGYLSRHDRCTGAQIWGKEVLSVGYTWFFPGQDILVQYNRDYKVLSKETGQVLSTIDLEVSGYFPVVYTIYN